MATTATDAPHGRPAVVGAAASTVVEMSPGGAVVIPEAWRAALGLPDGGALELSALDGLLVVRKADRLTPEEEEGVRRSRADYAAGRYRDDMTDGELDRLLDEADRRAG